MTQNRKGCYSHGKRSFGGTLVKLSRKVTRGQRSSEKRHFAKFGQTKTVKFGQMSLFGRQKKVEHEDMRTCGHMWEYMYKEARLG